MTITAPANFCTSCGEPLQRESRFCTGCGAPVAGAEAAIRPEEPSGPGTAPPDDAGEGTIARAADEAERRADAIAASFWFLVVREVDPSLEPDVDGLIYPLPDPNAPNAVVSETRDGNQVKRIVASGFKVIDLTGGKNQRLSGATDLRVDVVITDARVALACSKFTKGGGWTPLGVGALPLTLVLNGVSKARAAGRRRGKMLVGQVRYPWLAAVGGSTRSGFGTSEQLRLCVGTQDRRLLALDLTLPKNIDSTAVAAEIARRAARFRIESGDPKVAEHSAELDELTRATPLPSAKGRFGLRAIPDCWEVGGKSARLGSERS